MTAPLPPCKRLLLMSALLLSGGVVTARVLQPQATSTADSCPSGWSCADIGTPIPVGAAAAPADTPAPRGPAGCWHLVFGDEFNGTSLDTTKWNTCYWWAGSDNGCANGGDGSMNYYLPNEVSEGNDFVDLAAQNKTVTGSNGQTYNYVDGMIATNRTGSQTADRFSYTYGYMEIRAKLPAGWGYWPGFWLAASNHSWPPEIDAMEANGGDPHTVTLTIHWPKSRRARDR